MRHAEGVNPTDSCRADDAPYTILRTFEELEALRPTWDNTDWERIDPEPEFFRTVIETRMDVVGPYVLVLSGSRGPSVVARLEDVEVVAARLGYRSIWRPRVRSITVVPGGIDPAADASAVVTALQERLAERDADLVSLPGLRTDTALFREVTSQDRGLRRTLRIPNTHWRLELPESYEAFLRSRSRKTRENARMYHNRLTRAYPGRVEFKIFTEAHDLDYVLADLTSIGATTYQHGLGVAFADSQERRRLTELGLRTRSYRAHVLYLDGQPAAFWHGFIRGRTFFTATPGYNPALAEFSIGTLVLLHLIRTLIEDPAVEAVDYGFGDADYKRRFGSSSWQEVDVSLWARSPRAVAINSLRTGTEAMNLLAKRTLDRSGLTATVKRRWRAQLAKRRGSD